MKRKTASQNRASICESLWRKTPYANLIRYAPSGKYFARIRGGGKLIRQGLKPKALSVAKLKLADLEKQERARLEGQRRHVEGTAFLRDLVKECLERLDGSRCQFLNRAWFHVHCQCPAALSG